MTYNKDNMAKIPEDTIRISNEFKTRFNQLIDESDLSLKDFSKAVNVSMPVLRLASNFGIIPSVRILIKICDYCDLSLDYLLGHTNENEFLKSNAPSSFHDRYIILRDEKGVKDSQIANVMPFTKTHISEWKRCHTLPSIDYLLSLADYFEVSIDFLLGRTDIKK